MTSRDQKRERADEFVLGLLDADEEARLLAAMAGDSELSQDVAASRDRFVELDLGVEPASTSDDLWGRIESQLDRAQRAAAPTAETAYRPVAANSNTSVRWRRRSFMAMAAAVALAVLLGWSLTNRPEPQVIAVLMNDAGAPLAIVEDFGGPRARITPLVDIAVPPGRSMQVWTKPSEEIGPVSLGLLLEPSTALLTVPSLPRPRENQLYEITFEPEGGSPTGLPTGPILAKGFASEPR